MLFILMSPHLWVKRLQKTHYISDSGKHGCQARPVRATNRQQLYQQLYQQLFAPLFRVVDRPLKVVDQNNSSQNGRFWAELFSSTTFSNRQQLTSFQYFRCKSPKIARFFILPLSLISFIALQNADYQNRRT